VSLSEGKVYAGQPCPAEGSWVRSSRFNPNDEHGSQACIFDKSDKFYPFCLIAASFSRFFVRSASRHSTRSLDFTHFA
jgi:hypothetical protein